MLGSDKDRVIVDISIQLAHRLGLGVVAEGVEEEAQVRDLLAMGCHRGQGYLFCKPQSLAHFLETVEPGEFAAA